MDRLKWRDVKYVFNSALEQQPERLEAFLAEACGNDSELRQEVDRLLNEHFKDGEFLDSPLPRLAGLSAAAGRDSTVVGHAQVGDSRFEVRRKLGSGGFGEVYEAFDRKQTTLIALKYLRRFEPEQLYRLKREFRTLTDTRHPNLIRVYELFSNSDPPFFTMELLRGRDLGRYLREGGSAGRGTASRDFGKLRIYLQQLSKGLIALHEAQLVHRDVKPSNVFVTDTDRVVLLDFGLVKHLSAPKDASTMAVAGTPSYSAPEQLGARELTPASDWYGLGVLLFEALTGQVPFEGPLLEILSRKRDEDPPRPSDVSGGVPPDLDALCHQLLQRDPSRRPTGYDVLRTLEATADPIETEGPRAPCSSSILVGREPQLADLHDAFDAAERGTTVCVHVRGASGVGKTGVIRTFLEQLREANRECLVLNGRCYESESAPHKGLDELVDRLALVLKGLEHQRVQALLPRYFTLLTRLFPVLQQLQPPSRGLPEIADPREQRHRAFVCLRECLARLSESQPLILWIDDLHWCDFDTVRLLNDLVQAPDPCSCLILLSYRDTDIDRNPLLAALDRVDRSSSGGGSVRTLHIDNLLYDDARDLALALLRQHPDPDAAVTAANAIARESKGNPFFVTELVRYVQVMDSRRDLSAGAFGIGHVIKRRVGLLSGPALSLLELVAVAGQPLRSDVCAQAARLGDQYLEARTLLTREHLLRTHNSENGEELDVYHDQIREAITGYLSSEATTVYHGLLAQALEAAGSTDHERLSVHCEAAGSQDKAIAYAMRAATEASEALAFERAARLLRRVLDLVDQAAPGRADIFEELGEALSNAGRGKEAAEAFLQASQAAGPVRRLDLKRRVCEQYLRSGHFDEGMTLIRQLLREVGVAYPEGRRALLVSLLWHRLRLRLRLRRLRVTPVTSPRTETAADALRLDVCWTGAIGFSMVDVVRGADFHTRYTLLALKSGAPERVALGLAGELAIGRMDGGRPEAETDRLFRSAVRLATESDSPHAIALTTSMRGIADWIAGNWTDAYERNVQAAQIFAEKCSGVGWEVTIANTFALSALAFLGRWREHAARFPKLVRQAQELGDRHGAISLPLIAYTFVHSLASDRPAEARAMIAEALSAWSYQNFQMQHCDALFGNVETSLYLGDPNQALRRITDDWKPLCRSHLLEIQFYRVLMTGLRARASLASAVQAGPRERKRLIRIAGRDAARLGRMRPAWAVAMGHVIRAGLCTLEDANDQAEACLRRAEALFDTTQMRHFLASVRLRLAQLRPALTRENALAARWIAEEGIRNPLGIADMLVPGAWKGRA